MQKSTERSLSQKGWCNKPTKLQFLSILTRKILMLSNATIYKKRLLLRCIHHFKSDLINNMDHMRISGTEPSSVILSQKKYSQKLKRDVPNVPKQA